MKTTSPKILRKDYILVLLVSVTYFLTIQNVIPSYVNLIIAVLVSLYFFPIKLFIGNDFVKFPNKKKILVALSYYIVSNVITLTALVAYMDDLAFLHTTIFIYGLINLVFLFYFYFTENVSYNFILTCCVTILVSAVGSV